MSLARIVFLNQFQRDTQALRDSLVGLTQNQLVDPSFDTESTLAERLALVAAHYYREGEVLAHQAGQQFDPPMDDDTLWHLEAIRSRYDWTLSELEADLEDAWAFYGELLRGVSESDYLAYMQRHHGLLPRPAYELSREISVWRMRNR
jgi:hypothetical protein